MMYTLVTYHFCSLLMNRNVDVCKDICVVRNAMSFNYAITVTHGTFDILSLLHMKHSVIVVILCVTVFQIKNYWTMKLKFV